MSHLAFPYQGLYAIIDPEIHADFSTQRLLNFVALESDIPVIQLRMKSATTAEKAQFIEHALRLQEQRKFCLIVNDDKEFLDQYPEIHLHLGQNDTPIMHAREEYPDRIIGLSTHNLDEAFEARSKGATYIGCGAIFPTTSKENIIPLGLNGLQQIVNQVFLPTVAIGGINSSNIQRIAQTGCTMAAVISGLVSDNQFEGQSLHKAFLREGKANLQ